MHVICTDESDGGYAEVLRFGWERQNGDIYLGTRVVISRETETEWLFVIFHFFGD